MCQYGTGRSLVTRQEILLSVYERGWQNHPKPKVTTSSSTLSSVLGDIHQGRPRQVPLPWEEAKGEKFISQSQGDCGHEWPKFEHFQKLHDFLKLKLPPGFPVRANIPIFLTISANVAFQDFSWQDDLEEGLFRVPKNYTEWPLEDWGAFHTSFRP